nr:MAG TPA: hypothetical protein [Caudoviricetes sp.]
MANETEKTILPYLNVLEVETIDKSNVTKVIVIDKDDEVKVMDGSQLGSNNYQDLQFKPEINGVELNGNITSKELGVTSIEDVDNQITEKLVDYPTKEEVTAEITEATSGKQDILIQGNGIVIDNNTISADYSTINNKPSLNGVELIKPTEIIPSIQIQSVPDKVTISSIFGNQTGNPEELPAYNTETNTAGIITATLYAQLADKYTKAEIDQLNIEINKAINAKQGILTAGANITIVDNVISAFQNHFFLNLDVNDPDRQLEIYNFIRSNMDFYLFGQITYNEDTIVVPMTVVEHTNTIDLYGYYFKDNEVLVTINAIIVNNGQMTVKTTEVDLTNKGYTKDEVDEKLATKQGVFTPQAPLAFNEDKSQLSVDLSGYQPAGDYALKSEIPTKVSELTNDSNFVTEAEVSGDLANKADKTYVDEQLATKQPVGDYATKTELANKADSSVVESLSTQVATNTSDISVIKTKQEEDGNKIDALDKEMATKQDLLVSGTNIKTINSQSLLGEGNIVINSGSDIPYLFINSSTHLSGDFAAVKNAIANKTPFELYYVNILGYGDVAAPEVCFVLGENIQATFHFESGTTNHTLVTAQITPTGVSVDKSFHNYQEQLVSGTNIKTINGQDILGSGNLDISGGGGTTDYNQLTNKPQINSVELSGNKSLEDLGIPTKTSELTNDSGFLTSIPDEYVTETELNAGLGNKQDTLVSGTNIKTVNGESLLGSGNIDIESVSNPVTYGSGTQPQVHTILVVTQSEYDAISSKDPNTQYLIVE